MRDRAAALSLVRGRIILVAVFCAAAFSIVAARLIDVMVVGGGPLPGAIAAAAHPMRVDLVDRNGTLIARDLPVGDLYAMPAAFWDIAEAARQLAQAAGTNESRLKAA